MKELSVSWKIFRVISIIQLVLVAFKLMLALVGLVYLKTPLYSLLSAIVYGTIFFFVYQGLSLLNYNFPDVPLTLKQKKLFNRLFVVNFLLITFLFAEVVSNWWMVPLIANSVNARISSILALLSPLILSVLVFSIHLVFLAGMIRLRRVIYQNTIHTWYRQFDEPGQDQPL